MMALNTTRLKNGAEQLGLNLEDKQLVKFTIFAERLRDENTKYNLVGDADPETILTHHFLDSLSAVLGGAPKDGDRVLDLGSGAGLPGLALAIAISKAEFTLLDSSKKRTAFLRSAIGLLGLENVSAVCARAEEAGRQEGWREGFDLVTARAVAPLPVLVEYALPFLKTGGRLIAQRGPKAEEEVSAAKRAIRELNGGKAVIRPVKVPFLDAERRLVIIEKTGLTPDRYPRRTGVPLKRPL
jgi:16S rRNA (guanine527-N7)-methyltransferase